jgi:hypothetical protein
MTHRKTHFGAHFSHGWRGLWALAKNAGRTIREGIAALITHKGTSVIKQQKERAISFSGKLARSNNSLNFTRRFGSGSRSRFVTTAIDGYRKS